MGPLVQCPLEHFEKSASGVEMELYAFYYSSCTLSPQVIKFKVLILKGLFNHFIDNQTKNLLDLLKLGRYIIERLEFLQSIIRQNKGAD